jgi:class 3 adenylate cyclase
MVTTRMAGTSVCPSCGAENDAAARFCASCGAGLVDTCPGCGADTRAGAQFCEACGHRLDRPAASQEERKLVTVLFADLTGSTTLGEQLDPERLRVLLAEYFGAMASVIESWGGTVEKFVGDAVMAVFGIPALHEDDPERALRAALDMQARLREMNPELAERHGVELAMRIGVNTGEVLAGSGGDQFMVTGDAVNVAARLQQTAEPGEIVAGERAYLAARGALAFEPLDERALKGKSLPVAAFRVLGTAAAVRPRGLPGIAARLVGRDRELSLLETLYRAAVEEERPRLVTILGEAGVGKTRLTEEFVARVDGERPVAVYRGRCLPYGEGITYWALREILWSAAGIALGDSAAAAGERLEKLVRDVVGEAGVDAGEAERVLYALATTAGIALPENPLEEMSPESVGEELGLAWPRLLSGLAARGPTIVFVEDLHWAEPLLLDMIEHLVTRSSGGAFLVATGRPEFVEMRPGWSARPGMSQIRLDPLAEPDARALVADLLPSIRDELRDQVLGAAEGNPFFAEEIVRHLIDEGVLALAGAAVVEADGQAAVAIPDTVRALVAARVDALPAEEKRTLQEAAVVGRVFWATTLTSTRPEAPVRETLAALEDRGLVVTRASSSLPGQTELAFRHGLTREVAYQSIPKARRAVAHAAVARWINELAGDRRQEYVDLLAYHYEAAARPEDAALAWPTDEGVREELRREAVAALLEAGRAAKTRFAVDQALGFGDRALALAATDAERLAGLELKGEAAHAGVRADEAWSYYTEALAIAERLEEAETVAWLRARATLLWARYTGAFSGEGWKPHALEIVSRGLEESGEDAATFETGALLAGRASYMYWGIGDRTAEDSARDAERAIEIAETIDSPVLLSYALDALTSVVGQNGFCGAADLAERARRASKLARDRWGAHEMLVTASLCFSDAGRFDSASALADEAAREALALSPHHRLHGASAQTSALLPSGRLAELRAATAAAADLVAEEGMHTCFHGLIALAGQTLSSFEANDRAAADRTLEVLDATSAAAVHAGYQYRILEILRPLLDRSDFVARFDRAGEPESVTAQVYRLRIELGLCALAGDWARFETLVPRARTLATRACAPYLDWLADWGEAVRLATLGRTDEALETARAATSALDAFGDRYQAARLLADLLPLLDSDTARGVAGEVAARLESMGALASAAQVKAL